LQKKEARGGREGPAPNKDKEGSQGEKASGARNLPFDGHCLERKERSRKDLLELAKRENEFEEGRLLPLGLRNVPKQGGKEGVVRLGDSKEI